MKIIKRTSLKKYGKKISQMSHASVYSFHYGFKRKIDNDQTDRGNPDCLNV